MNKIKNLRYYDISFITFVMFGIAIYSSSLEYMDLLSGATTTDETLEFSPADNWLALASESVQLLIVLTYLYIRKFDFNVWTFKINSKVILYSLLLFVVSALIMDAVSILFKYNDYQLIFTGEFIYINEFINTFDFSFIPFSVMNGFFEEIFFLGICLQVKSKYINWALIYSLIIRFSFHTYQGILPALTIGLVIGLLFYYFYYKKGGKNLAPFVIAHIMADIFGASVIGYLLY